MRWYRRFCSSFWLTRLVQTFQTAWRMTRNCPWEHWLIMALVALFLLALEIIEAIDL